MNRCRLLKNRFIIVSFVTLLLAGCNGKSFDYVNPNEIPPGPGVFTGEKGEWTVYDSEGEKEKTVAETGQNGNKAEPTEAAVPPSATDESEYREFQQFQQWKKEKREFEAFQEWKQSRQGTEEYQEFKQWQEWKTYQEWLESQKKTE
jgi:hypothetical protein